jgi:hypothetical protein
VLAVLRGRPGVEDLQHTFGRELALEVLLVGLDDPLRLQRGVKGLQRGELAALVRSFGGGDLPAELVGEAALERPGPAERALEERGELRGGGRQRSAAAGAA